MSDMGNWRDASNWRTRDPAGQYSRSTRPQGRSGTSSWRTKGASTSDVEPQPEQRRDWARGTRPYDCEQTNKPPQKDEGDAAKAIAEGRRIYVGNLRYQAKPDDIEGLLGANDLGSFVKIHMSIDPFTGRNPSYCFVEFEDQESANKAMSTLEGKLLLGREVKCRPCIPKGSASGGRRNEGLNRWGNWSGEKNSRDNESEPVSGQSPSAENAQSPPPRYAKDFTGQRLYVGGLPRMHDQATNFSEISELFKDFQIEAISKRITAHESTRVKTGNHDFCFVDFATPGQAEAAINALNGTTFRGGPLKVSMAGGRSNKWKERDNLDNATLLAQ
ncbi:RNA-binding domain-containing protein [Hypoxylon cercidicola]|nr:RNA-binding domain-containing protein [Hypoxylon cercidicola]